MTVATNPVAAAAAGHGCSAMVGVLSGQGGVDADDGLDRLARVRLVAGAALVAVGHAAPMPGGDAVQVGQGGVDAVEQPLGQPGAAAALVPAGMPGVLVAGVVLAPVVY